MKKIIITVFLAVFAFLLFGSETMVGKADTTSVSTTITFIELGSITCVPCKQMEKVLEATEEKYGDQIEVIFYDIMKDRSKSKEYNVRIMPTQVFLNSDGKEIHRHIGYYPQKQLDEFLQKQGLIPLENNDE